TVADRLAEMGLGDAGPRFWMAVRENIGTLSEVSDWYQICRVSTEPSVEDAPYLAEAASLLPPEPWDEGTWGRWTALVKEATGRRGRSLFRPLRLALTGREHGPEMSALLPEIGRARALDRLGDLTPTPTNGIVVPLARKKN